MKAVEGKIRKMDEKKGRWRERKGGSEGIGGKKDKRRWRKRKGGRKGGGGKQWE